MNGIVLGLLLPFAGTTLGAACVFLMKKKHPVARAENADRVCRRCDGCRLCLVSSGSFDRDDREGGVHERGAGHCGLYGRHIVPLLLDTIVPHQHIDSKQSEGPRSHLSKTAKLVFAITLHNIPEGMAVGVALAGAMEHNSYMPMAGAVALSIGIAIQNFPEGAIVSMPLRSAGNSRKKSFMMGALSGIVEPIGAILTIMLASFILPILPYLLAFAAGAMFYVVVEELIPETQEAGIPIWAQSVLP